MNNQFIKACELNDLILVKRLKGYDINYKNSSHLTGLMIACEKGYIELANYLIINKAKINIKNIYGETALFFAVNNDHLNIIKLLLDNGALINLVNNDNQNVFFCLHRKLPIVTANLLIDYGININIIDNMGNTPLSLVCKMGYIEMVELLISKNININIQNQDGLTCLHITILNKDLIDNYLNIVKVLLDAKANVEIEDYTHHSPLYYANLSNDVKLFHVLFVSSNIKNTALLLDLFDNVNILKIILANGSQNINIQDQYGDTPLMMYASYDKIEFVKMLIFYGADVNLKNQEGDTALILALQNKSYDVSIVLIKANSDLKSVNNYGDRPFNIISRDIYFWKNQLIKNIDNIKYYIDIGIFDHLVDNDLITSIFKYLT